MGIRRRWERLSLRGVRQEQIRLGERTSEMAELAHSDPVQFAALVVASAYSSLM